MTLKECFHEIGGDYEGVVGRLVTEERVKKYLKKFVDSADYAELLTALENKRWDDGFRLSHNIKGICLTLGLTKLNLSSDLLCETMRHGAPVTDITDLIDNFVNDYEAAVSAINKVDL